MFKRGRTKKYPGVTNLTQLYHGIEVVTGTLTCEAAAAITRRRFLSDEAPRLPIENCDNPQGCECRYTHFKDRRTDARRDCDSGLPQRAHPEEKRGQGGRRITDG